MSSEPVVTLTVWQVVPSWNEILALSLWARMRKKILIKVAVLCAIRCFECEQSIKKTGVQSRSLMHSWRLDTWLMTRQEKLGSKSFQRRLDASQSSEP